jgi:hypothetical protein
MLGRIERHQLPTRRYSKIASHAAGLLPLKDLCRRLVSETPYHKHMYRVIRMTSNTQMAAGHR